MSKLGVSFEISRKAFGRMFAEIRIERNISQNAVAENLMTQRAISNFEKNGEWPSWLVYNALMRRLGRSTQFFMTMLTRREYDYLCWREKILYKIEDGSIQKEDWDSEMARSRQIHEVLQEQFVEFWQGYTSGNAEKMNRAIARTVANYPAPLVLTQCVSSEEIMYMLLSIETHLKNSPMQWAETKQLLLSIIHYIETNYLEEEQVKVYGKAVCLYGEYIQDTSPEERIAHYKKAFDLFRRQAALNGMCDILRGLLRESDTIEEEEREEYRNELCALEWVKKEFHVKEQFLTHVEWNQEFCLLNEVLMSYRRERGLQIQDMKEHVCSEKTYRALEAGKRDARKGTYRLLADYMDIPIGTYSAEIVSDSYEDYRIAEQIKHLLHRQKDDSALRLLGELEERLGDKAHIKENAQFISSVRDILLFEAGELTLEEYKERVEASIRLTVPGWNPNYEDHFYTQREMILVYYEAHIFRMRGEFDVAIELLSRLWEQLEQSEILLVHRSDEALLINILWKNLLTDKNEYDQAMERVRLGVELSFQAGCGTHLDELVFEPGWIINKQRGKELSEQEEEEMIRYFENSYYISRIFFRNVSQKTIRNYCKEQGIELNI